MRIGLVAAAVSLALVGFAAAEDVRAASRKHVRIPAQQLEQALQSLAKQRQFQVIYRSDIVGERSSNDVSGEYTPSEALDRMLERTGLTYQYLDDHTIMIVPLARPQEAGAVASTDFSRAQNSGAPADRLRLAQAEQAATNQAAPAANPSGDSPSRTQIEEIVVTAQKRKQRLQDVPISLAVLTAEDIDRRGLVSGEDYLRGIPGVNQVADAFGGGAIVIRGMETSPINQNFSSGPTTATYFGETPTTNSAGLSGNMNVDLKLVDIERVEVLRGPQGTAFGNSSLGGAVRTIPVAPDLERFEGKVSAGYSGTSESGGSNNMVQAVGNLPLVAGKLALRASAFRFEDSGYYRNVAGSDPAFRAAAVTPYGAQAYAVDQDEVGESEYTGGRIAALFEATENLSFTLLYLKQETQVDGVAIAGTGGLAMSGTGAFDQAVLQVAPEHSVRGQTSAVADTDIDLANAVMEWNIGWGSVVATVSHVDSNTTNTTPYSWCCAALPLSVLAPSEHREDVGEVRLTTQLDGAWQFLAGVYTERLKDEYGSNYLWHGDPALNLFAPDERELGNYFDRRKLEQQALFGEVSWEFMPRWTLTGGARAYDYERTGQVDTTPGAFFGPAARTTITDADASGSTFRGNLSFKPNDDATLYAGWSQGFRLGSPQPGLTATCDLDNDGVVDGSGILLESTRSTRSDEVDNYELGAKLSLLDGRVNLSADVYRMDWTGVPIRVNVGTCGSYTANAGAARSQGVELQANFQITPSLRIDIGGSRIDAELTEDAPGLFVPAFAGDRLPGSPELNGNLAIQYQFKLFAHDALVRLDSIYVGDFYGDLQESPNNEAGEYVKADATARVAINQLTVDVFVRNITNQDDYTFRHLGLPNHGYRLRPRTLGVQLSYEF